MIIGGTQDVGSVEQLTAVNSAAMLWRDARLFGFFEMDFITQEGDGGAVAIDNFSRNDASIRYTMGNNLNMFFRRDYAMANPSVVPAWLNFQRHGDILPAPFSGLHSADTTAQSLKGFRFVPIALNAVDPGSIIIAANAIYESHDQGATVTIAGQPRRNRRVDAIAYGSRNPDGTIRNGVIYASRGNELSIRSDFNADWTRRFINDTTYSAADTSIIRAIVLDPDNWRRAYLITRTKAFRLDDAELDTEAVLDLTSNLAEFSDEYEAVSDSTMDVNLICGALFKSEAGMSVLLAGGMGGVYRLRYADLATESAQTLWEKFGIKLPRVSVRALGYNREDDILIAGTFGRGAWTIANAAESLVAPKFVSK